MRGRRACLRLGLGLGLAPKVRAGLGCRARARRRAAERLQKSLRLDQSSLRLAPHDVARLLRVGVGVGTGVGTGIGACAHGVSATSLRALPCVTTSSMEPLPTTNADAEAAAEAAPAAGPAAAGLLARASLTAAVLLAGLLAASMGAALAGPGLWPCAFLSSMRRAPSAMPSAATVLVRARA